MTNKEILSKIKELIVKHGWAPGDWSVNGDKERGYTLFGATKQVISFQKSEYDIFITWLNQQCWDVVDLAQWQYYSYQPQYWHIRKDSQKRYIALYAWKGYQSIDFLSCQLGMNKSKMLAFLDNLIEKEE